MKTNDNQIIILKQKIVYKWILSDINTRNNIKAYQKDWIQH